MRSRNNDGPMQDGQTRKFKIDKTKKKNCKLPGEKIVEIEIKKENEFFRMVNAENQVYVQCEAGYVPSLIVRGKADQCGIGKILMQLCFNEDKIHNVARKDANKAINKMNKYIRDCQKVATCKDENLKRLRKWIKSYCSKIIYLEMFAEPMTAAHVYFKSAMASGFIEMFILSNDEEVHPSEVESYPKEGPCSVEMLQESYTDDGHMEVDGGEKTLVWGSNWFFCYPKEPKKESKCTIL